jgi:hypothetical protein
MSGDERSRERPQDPAAVAARALAYLRAEGALRTIDGEFAALLRRRFDTDPLVALAGALAMRALARADDLLAALAVRTTLPPLEAWQAALRASPLVECTAVSGGGVEGAARESAAVENAAVESAALEGAALEGAALEGAALEGAALEGAALEGAALESASVEAMPQRDNAAPSAHAPSHAQKPTLLAFEYGRVSLRRYARYEQALAEALFARGIHGVDASNASDAAIADTLGAARDANAESSLAATLRKLFALSNDNAAFDRQAFAAWRSLQRRLLLITGGPGTGKTTTVARLLALHIANHVSHWRRRPAARRCAWPRPLPPASRRISPKAASMRRWPRASRAVRKRCIACSAHALAAPAFVITPRIRCRSIWWWWTKPR